MQDRRSFFRTLTSLTLAFPFATGIAARAAAAPPAGELFPEDFYIVDGWVLTRADVIALELDDL